jgi:hypothetical protein
VFNALCLTYKGAAVALFSGKEKEKIMLIFNGARLCNVYLNVTAPRTRRLRQYL